MECTYDRSRCNLSCTSHFTSCHMLVHRGGNSNYQRLGVVWNRMAGDPGACRCRMVEQVCSFNGFGFRYCGSCRKCSTVDVSISPRYERLCTSPSEEIILILA